MKKKSNNSWLFSFTDLAFLLLISLSVIPSADSINIRFAEMNVPVVPDSTQLAPMQHLREVWELQVYPVTDEHPVPYRIIRGGVGNRPDAAGAMLLSAEELIPALESLKQRNIQPLLLPEKTSLSQDFLFAAGALGRVWSTSGGHTVVQPDLAEKE
ncbi:MAG: hypothetical protein R2940_05185 [Syntrophotaleaceae bacterium]